MVWSPNGSGNVRVDEILTNISLGFENQDMVGERLFPALNVAKQSAKYYIFGRESWLPEQDLRAPGTVANEIPGMNLSTAPYYAEERALQIPVTDEERELTTNQLSPEADATNLVTGKILMGREKRMFDFVANSANYNASNVVTLSGTSQWNDFTNSDPIAVVRAGFRRVNSQLFLDPNTMVLPYEVYSILQDHPKLQQRIMYAQKAILTVDLIAELFGVQNVIVPGVGIGSGNPGQTMTVSYLWGKNVLLAYVPPRPGLRVPAFGYEFVWAYPGGRGGNSGGGRAMVTDRWREEPRKSDLIRVSRRYDLRGVGTDSTGLLISGYLIKNAVA
jgi:hypothetical protein